MTEFKPISLKKIKSYPLKNRNSKVSFDCFGKPWKKGSSLGNFINSLPKILVANDFKEIVERISHAASYSKTIILAMGAHSIKVGLNPVIIDLMERGILSGIAMNGAGIIHDSEIAMIGNTSEDVAAELGSGSFGMAEETGRLLNDAIIDGAKHNSGLGESIGKMLLENKFPYNNMSIVAKACELDIPVTVHVAVGTDIIHCHPNADGAAIGKTSHNDFRLFAGMVSTLEKGVYINLGSAVIMPEVFLKAISVVRNLGHNVKDFTTVNMDFIRQYRPMTNVVQRPVLDGGKGFSLVGHNEIMFPLLAAAVIENLIKDNKTI